MPRLLGPSAIAAQRGGPVVSAPTPRELELLRLINSSSHSLGYAPTLVEMAGGLAVSRVRAQQLLAELVGKGLVAHEKGKARTARLTSAGARLARRAA